MVYEKLEASIGLRSPTISEQGDSRIESSAIKMENPF
jgi:hypothetical protein